MSKRKLTYPQDTPNSIQDITKAYIENYIAGEVKKGAITKETLSKWIEAVEKAEKENPDDKIKVFNAYRKDFVKLFFKHLAKDKEEDASAFYKRLLDDIKG